MRSLEFFLCLIAGNLCQGVVSAKRATHGFCPVKSLANLPERGFVLPAKRHGFNLPDTGGERGRVWPGFTWHNPAFPQNRGGDVLTMRVLSRGRQAG